jgi:hypothetical protein
MQFYNNTPLNFHFRETNTPPREIGKSVSLVRSSAGEFSQIRPYEAGESSLRIDSKRSRFESNQIVVREYLIEKEFFVGIIISLDPVLRYGTERYSKFDSIDAILRMLIISIHAHEYAGNIYVIAYDFIFEFPLPDSEMEIQDLINTLETQLYATENIPQWEIQRKCFQKVYTQVREWGVIYLWDYLPEALFSEFAREYHIQTAAFEIVHEDELEDLELWDVHKREYGVYGLCTSPNNLWLLLQKAFQTW